MIDVAPSPWTAKQGRVLIVLLAVGVVGLVAGYAGASGTLRVSHQVAWVNLAGAALIASGAGVVLFLTGGRRAVGRRRMALFGNLYDYEVWPTALDPSAAVAAEKVVATPKMTRYHRADCSFVAGKPGVAAAPVAKHERAGRRPCGVCLPGGER